MFAAHGSINFTAYVFYFVLFAILISLISLRWTPTKQPLSACVMLLWRNRALLITVGDVDNAMIALRFTGSGLGNVEVSRTAIYGYDIQTEIVGSKGTLQVGYLRQTPVLTLTRSGAAYTRQIEHFVECLRDQKPPTVTPADSRAALQIGLAATLSEHEQRVVYVNDVQSS